LEKNNFKLLINFLYKKSYGDENLLENYCIFVNEGAGMIYSVNSYTTQDIDYKNYINNYLSMTEEEKTKESEKVKLQEKKYIAKINTCSFRGMINIGFEHPHNKSISASAEFLNATGGSYTYDKYGNLLANRSAHGEDLGGNHFLNILSELINSNKKVSFNHEKYDDIDYFLDKNCLANMVAVRNNFTDDYLILKPSSFELKNNIEHFNNLSYTSKKNTDTENKMIVKYKKFIYKKFSFLLKNFNKDSFKKDNFLFLKNLFKNGLFIDDKINRLKKKEVFLFVNDVNIRSFLNKTFFTNSKEYLNKIFKNQKVVLNNDLTNKIDFWDSLFLKKNKDFKNENLYLKYNKKDLITYFHYILSSSNFNTINYIHNNLNELCLNLNKKELFKILNHKSCYKNISFVSLDKYRFKK
jgi:hypothetical protein